MNAYQAPASVPDGQCRYIARPPAGFRGNALLITLNQKVGIRREGESIGVYVGTGGRLGLKVSCIGPQATIQSIDRIIYRPLRDNHHLTVDESGGRFEPGASPERGGDEIEIFAIFPRKSHRANLRPGVRILGTSGPDKMRIGRRGKDVTAINLDVGRDGGYKDADVLAFATWPGVYTLFGKDGNDQLGSSGNGPEFNGPLPEGHVTLRANDGADQVFGGPRRDLIRGGEGDDVIYARGGDDVIDPGGGADRIFAGRGDDAISATRDESRDQSEDFYSGGPGKDTIRALNGHLESIGCGADIDNFWVDPFDLWDHSSCEKQH